METAASRRGFILGAMAAGSSVLACGQTPPGGGSQRASGASGYSLDSKGLLRIAVPGLKESVRFIFASDTHLALADGRDAQYAGNYARMAKYPGSPKAFSQTLSKAKELDADLVALTGDIISFPTLANVEYVAGELRKCGVPWIYTAGNHDWHFEGDAGSDASQRDAWMEKRLGPLYPDGVNPLMYSMLVKGVRFVAIDNSIYHITAAQLAFWREEAAKGDPVVLLMHIPFWTEGFGLYTCANPEWGAATDAIWQIERREKWAARQSEESFALRREVLSAPNLVAVLTGHIHRGLSASERGKYMFSVPQNNKGAFWETTLMP